MKMNDAVAVLALALMPAFLGCPAFEPEKPLTTIRIFRDGAAQAGISIEAGETITLTAQVNPSSRNVFIVWEISGKNAAIVSSGEGEECSIRGLSVPETGSETNQITVKAWRNSGDAPLERRITINVKEPQIRDIIYTGPLSIFVGEEKLLSARLVPDWAGGETINWESSATAIATVTPNGIIEGKSAGTVSLTITAGATTKTVDVTVIQPPTLSDIAIYRNGENINGGSITIGLYEEIALNAVPTPLADTFFIWRSSSDAVSVDSNGTVKGLKAGETAEITLNAGGITGEKTLNVTVNDPVSGLNILYDNDAGLPVSNIIWLSPGETVNLKVDSAGGIPDTINWTAGSNEVRVSPSPDGKTCTLYGGAAPGYFNAPPVEIRITAQNADNRGTEANAVVFAKVQQTPLWAWDRARDADLNAVLPALLAAAGNTGYVLTGRGTHSPLSVPFRVFGNVIPYENAGLKLNSSNNYSGKNPDPVAAPGNSTRIALGTRGNATTAAEHQEGPFDFLEAFCEKEGGVYSKDSEENYILKPEAEGKMIRVSVDYEIIWTAGAGRDLWIMLNNNNANAAQSVMGTDSQILIELLTAARGTRATAVTRIDVWDMVERQFKGIKTLENAFVCIIALSNGGSIYVSGIRIEYED